MKSAIDYANHQKRNGHLSLAITIAIIVGSFLLGYFSKTGVVKNLNFIFALGLGVIILLFVVSTTMFYRRYRSVKLILKDPLVHWKYDSSNSPWIKGDDAETIISNHGIYYSPAHDRLHTFWSVASKLEHLKMGKLSGHEDYKTLDFFFIRAVTYEGNRISAALNVPVPKGEEDTATKIIDQINQNVELSKAKHIKMLAGIAVSFIAFFAILVVIFRAID